MMYCDVVCVAVVGVQGKSLSSFSLQFLISSNIQCSFFLCADESAGSLILLRFHASPCVGVLFSENSGK